MRRRVSRIIVWTAAFAAVTAVAPPAVADTTPSTVDEIAGLRPPATTHPKREGYFEPVTSGAVPGVPGVSTRLLTTATGDAQELVDNAPRLAGGVATALTDAANDATEYTLWEAYTVIDVFDESGVLVYRDKMTYRFRQAGEGGKFSDAVAVPEESFCKTYPAFPSAFTLVTETCWFVFGGTPSAFNFVTGSRFSSYLGSAKYGTHAAEDGYTAWRDGSELFVHELRVNGGGECSAVSELPPRWTAKCDGDRWQVG